MNTKIRPGLTAFPKFEKGTVMQGQDNLTTLQLLKRMNEEPIPIREIFPIW